MEINDYPNYLIYEDGRVWSKLKKIFLKPSINSGYLMVCLYKNKKPKWFSIHRLIALHYIPNPNNKLEVDHINRITKDNRIENLRWATRQEQMHNRSITTNTGEKYISKLFRKSRNTYIYSIEKKGYFNKNLSCLCWKLKDAIELRDKLLIKYEIVEPSI